MPDPIVFAGVAPHPPLLVPEVGGDRISGVADSQEAMRDFARRLVESGPETIVLISPHSPLDPRRFLARSTPQLHGDFAEFRARDVALSFENDLALLEAIGASAADQGIELRLIEREYPLDHGALVPLYYMREAGWTGPIVVLAFTLQSNEAHLAFGRAIRRAAGSLGRRIAFVASGDLSHRLIVDGPYQYEPTAHLFDEQIVAAIGRGDAQAVLDIDADLKERAGECGYRSIVVALGAVEKDLQDHQVLSYEGPFGVGYMVAVLSDKSRRREPEREPD